MYARVTKYKMKADSVDAANEIMNNIKDRILGLPGMIQFVNVMQPDGAGYIVSIVESQEVSEANNDKVAALWGAFADHLEGAPEPDGGDVVANWTP